MQKNTLTRILQIALLVAAEIVLSRFLSISTSIVKIGFGFVPIAVVAMLYGPLWAAAAAALADFLGAILFPIGAYFPGFTLTAALTGFLFGLFLYRRANLLRVFLAVVAVCIGLNFFLDTLWLHMITGLGYTALLPTRILKCAVMMPVQAVALWFMQGRVNVLEKYRA